MRYIFGGIWLLVVNLLVTTVGAGQDKPIPPSEQYKALLKEYDRASSSGRVLTDEERLKFVGSVYKLRNQLAQKFVALAEKYPDDPVALEALLQAVWQVNSCAWPIDIVGEDSACAIDRQPCNFSIFECFLQSV